MKRDRKVIANAVAAALALPGIWQVAVAQEDAATPVMSEVVVTAAPVSYTHLTLPTNREV